MIYCSKCGYGSVPSQAFCAKCGSPLVSAENTHSHVTVVVQESRWNPTLAGILSFLIPGLGQLYKGQIAYAIVWFLVVTVGYFLFIIPGIILHIICIVAAVRGYADKYDR